MPAKQSYSQQRAAAWKKLKAITRARLKAEKKNDPAPLSYFTKKRHHTETRKAPRIPRWNYYDPVWRGLHPVPVSGVTASFLTQNQRTVMDVITLVNQPLYVMFTFTNQRHRLMASDAARNVIFVDMTPDATLEQVRPLCAAVRLRNTTEVGKVQGGVSVWVAPEPVHLERDGANVMLTQPSLDRIEAVTTRSTKTKYFTGAHFYKERKFVVGPSDQIRYKTFHPWEPAAYNNFDTYLEYLKDPATETLIMRFDPTPNQVQMYRLVLDEQWATRHAAGTSLAQMQQTQQELIFAHQRIHAQNVQLQRAERVVHNLANRPGAREVVQAEVAAVNADNDI